MAVLPAKFHVDLEALKRAANAKTAQLASEEEFTGRFPDCETGAMPPFETSTGSMSLPMTAWRQTRRSRSMQELTGEPISRPGRISNDWPNPKSHRLAAGRSAEAA